jgi:TM2 domain-containing membrane protein YozV
VYSKREWLIALLLSIFVGVFGIDRFYLGKVGTGILKLLTFGGFTIWAIIDIILIALKRLDDKSGMPLA